MAAKKLIPCLLVSAALVAVAGRAAAEAPLMEPVEPVVITGQATVAGVAAGAAEALSGYIRIPTTNPPGDEIAGARYLSGLLEAEGLEPSIYESEPGRANVYARLPGTGEKKALLLLSHMDVVPADESQWQHGPYQAEVVDGDLYGRGALDCKGPGIIHALTLIALKRLGQPLERDIVLLATADEEVGGGLGAKWMVDNHFELFGDVEFVLNEGGFIHRVEDKPLLYSLNAAEKGPCWFKVTARGEPGHGSRPAKETAPTRLIEALHKLVAWERPHEVGPVVAGYYAAYAAIDESHARQFRQLDRALEDDEFYRWFTDDPSWAALIQDTVAPTVLVGSSKTNVVPREVSAEVDSRLLPGHACDDFLGDVRALIGGEFVTVEALAVAFPSSQSRLDNELTRAVERLAAEEADKAVVLPGLLTGFTDSHYFREKGIDAYGFVPLVVDPGQRKSVHAPDERVTVAELEAAVKRMVRLVELVSQ